MAGTEGALTPPLWSYDSRSLAFGRQGVLLQANLDGGTPQAICTCDALGFAWGADDVVLLGATRTGGIRRTTAGGGPTTEITTLAAGERRHFWPKFLRDGRRFVYAADTGLGYKLILARVGSTERTELATISQFNYEVVSDYILYRRDNSILAQRFDAARMAALRAEGVVMAARQGFEREATRGC